MTFMIQPQHDLSCAHLYDIYMAPDHNLVMHLHVKSLNVHLYGVSHLYGLSSKTFAFYFDILVRKY
jgi:hypothetical protein